MIRDHSDRDATTTAVTITRGAVGGHVGLRYFARGGARHLHLAFHHELCDEDWAQARVKWITPGFSDPLGTVRSVAALVASRHADDGEVPYALRPADAAIDPASGELRLNASLGLVAAASASTTPVAFGDVVEFAAALLAEL